MKNVIVINGPSSAGKSTLAGFISREYGYDVVSIDDYLVDGDTHSLKSSPIEDVARRVNENLGQGKKSVVDYIFKNDEYRIFEEIVGREEFFLIRLYADERTLVRRAESRSDEREAITIVMSSRKYLKDLDYDLEIDSSKMTLEELKEKIKEQFAEQ